MLRGSFELKSDPVPARDRAHRTVNQPRGDIYTVSSNPPDQPTQTAMQTCAHLRYAAARNASGFEEVEQSGLLRDPGTECTGGNEQHVHTQTYVYFQDKK